MCYKSYKYIVVGHISKKTNEFKHRFKVEIKLKLSLTCESMFAYIISMYFDLSFVRTEHSKVKKGIAGKYEGIT